MMSVAIRRATASDTPGIAKVHVDSWRTTYEGILPSELLAQLSYENRETVWTRVIGNSTSYVLVAENESGQIIGFADGGRERDGDSDYKGELYTVYLLKGYQGQGIGKQLFQGIVRHLKEQGLNTMLVWVLSENPSRMFYERQGGKAVRKKEIGVAGKAFTEIGYGWQNLEI